MLSSFKEFPSSKHFLRRLVDARDCLLASGFRMHLSQYLCTRSKKQSESSKTTNQITRGQALLQKARSALVGWVHGHAMVRHEGTHRVSRIPDRRALLGV